MIWVSIFINKHYLTNRYLKHCLLSSTKVNEIFGCDHSNEGNGSSTHILIASTTYLRESHVDEIEPALQSFGDHHPASARWTHGCQYMHVLIFKQDV